MFSMALGCLHFSFWDLVVSLSITLLSGFLCLLERSHEARSFAINKRGVLLDGMGPRKKRNWFERIRRMERTNGTGMKCIPRSSTTKISQLRRGFRWMRADETHVSTKALLEDRPPGIGWSWSRSDCNESQKK